MTIVRCLKLKCRIIESYEEFRAAVCFMNLISRFWQNQLYKLIYKYTSILNIYCILYRYNFLLLSISYMFVEDT